MSNKNILKLGFICITMISLVLFGVLSRSSQFKPGDCLVPPGTEQWEIADKLVLVKKVGNNHYLIEQRGEYGSFVQSTKAIKELEGYIKIECPDTY